MPRPQVNPRHGSPGDADPQCTHRRPRSPPAMRRLQARRTRHRTSTQPTPAGGGAGWTSWGTGPSHLHSCTVRSLLPAPLSHDHLNVPSHASLLGWRHSLTRPQGCYWRCLPGTGRPGCLGSSRHSAGLIPHLMSQRGARSPAGIRPRPGAAPVGPQLLVQTGAPGGENMAGGMRLLQSLRS